MRGDPPAPARYVRCRNIDDARFQTSPSAARGGWEVAECRGRRTSAAESSIGSSSFGSSSCPVECKSDGKTIQVFHSTNHGTGLDDPSVHSDTNVIPHTCKHNKDNNACECTCKGDDAPGARVADTNYVSGTGAYYTSMCTHV